LADLCAKETQGKNFEARDGKEGGTNDAIAEIKPE
jgi:hypothetical protein